MPAVAVVVGLAEPRGAAAGDAVVDEAEDARRRERFPLGARLTLVDMETPGSEHLLDEVLASEPITWMPDLGGLLVTCEPPAGFACRRPPSMTIAWGA